MRKYRGTRKIIAIQAINNFTAHKVLNPRVEVMSDTFRYHIINDWEKLIDQESKEVTTPILNRILTTICMHIGSTKFLEEEALEIKYSANGAIRGRCPSLNWRDNHEEEIAKKVINEDDDNKTPNQKTRRIRKEK